MRYVHYRTHTAPMRGIPVRSGHDMAFPECRSWAELCANLAARGAVEAYAEAPGFVFAQDGDDVVLARVPPKPPASVP